MKTQAIVSNGENVFILADNEKDILETLPISSFSAEEQESFEKIACKRCFYDESGKLRLIRAPFTHCHTDGSTLDGAVKASTLAELGGEVIAITDHGSMTETYSFYTAMKKLGKLPIIGYEAYTENMFDGEKAGNHMILLVKNMQGYRNLCKIVSEAEQNFYRKPQVSYEMLKKYHEGVICTSACLGGEIPKAIMDGNVDRAEEVIDLLVDIFGDDFYLEVQRHDIPAEKLVNKTLFELAHKKGIKVVAAPDSHYAKPEDKVAHEVLLAIGTHKTFDDPNRFKFEGNNYHIPTQSEFEDLWADKQEVWAGLMDIVKKVDFDFETGKLFMPNFPCPDGKNQDEYFTELVHKGFEEKFPSFKSEEERKVYEDRLKYEIDVILQMGFSGYFLIVQDYAEEARRMGGFVGPGRGSAVGSLCAYCLGITNLDPIPYGLLFERFLNPERVTMPDIDMDFDVQIRDQVIEYVRRKYGTECVSKIITFGTLSARTALRDVGRVMGVDLSKMDRFSKAVPKEIHITLKQALEKSAEFKKMYDDDPELQRVYEIASKLEGLNRHRSTHACGVVIGNQAINNFVPEVMITDKTLKTKVRTSSFVGPQLEELGLLKMDFLGLRNMSVIRDVCSLNPEVPKDGRVPLTDPYVYKLLGTGHTVGVFQVESVPMQKLMRQMFYDVADRIDALEKKYGITGYGSRMKGTDDAEKRQEYMDEMDAMGQEMFERLIAAISLFRPGPMDYIPQYIEGMTDPSSIHYDCPQLEPILNKTYGVLVYQGATCC